MGKLEDIKTALFQEIAKKPEMMPDLANNLENLVKAAGKVIQSKVEWTLKYDKTQVKRDILSPELEAVLPEAITNRNLALIGNINSMTTASEGQEPVYALLKDPDVQETIAKLKEDLGEAFENVIIPCLRGIIENSRLFLAPATQEDIGYPIESTLMKDNTPVKETTLVGWDELNLFSEYLGESGKEMIKLCETLYKEDWDTVNASIATQKNSELYMEYIENEDIREKYKDIIPATVSTSSTDKNPLVFTDEHCGYIVTAFEAPRQLLEYLKNKDIQKARTLLFRYLQSNLSELFNSLGQLRMWLVIPSKTAANFRGASKEMLFICAQKQCYMALIALKNIASIIHILGQEGKKE